MNSLPKPDSTHEPPCGEIIKTERLVLRALCMGTPEGSVRAAARCLLRDYSWHEPAHRAIFEVLDSLPSDLPEVVRDQLPARLTLKGYPDLDFEDLFRPHSLSKEETERLIQMLKYM